MTNHGTSCDCLEQMERERKFKRFQEAWTEFKANRSGFVGRDEFKAGFLMGRDAAMQEKEISKAVCCADNEEKLAQAEKEIERLKGNLDAVKKAYFCDENKTTNFCACQHSCFVRWQANNVMDGKTIAGEEVPS